MKNQAIRQAAKEHGVKLWQIAAELHITDSSFSRKMRQELPTAEQSKILQIIVQLAEEQGATA